MNEKTNVLLHPSSLPFRDSFATFPQKLWKSLWKSGLVKSQVLENFKLLAFCTHALQFFQSLHQRKFSAMRFKLKTEQAHLHLVLALACAVLASLPSCVKLPRHALQASGQTAPPVSQADAARLININTASSEELEKLPGIGKALAARIISFRELYGRFRRAEHLMMIRGISDRRFRAMRALITVE
jgi:competence ComEA-like helix-hairpin-helix protein